VRERAGFSGIGYRVSGFVIIFLVVTVSVASAAAERANPVQVERMFLEGNYERVIRDADMLIDSGSRDRDEAYYLKGLSQIKLGRFSDARSSFGTLLSKYPRSRRAFDARIGIGDAHFLEGNAAEAVTAYNAALRDYPGARNIPAVYYKLGNCYQRLGSPDKAAFYFDKSNKLAPLSFESKMAPVSGRPAVILQEPVRAQERSNIVPLRSEVSREKSEPLRAEEGGFSIQVGAFKNSGNAERLAQLLSRKGFDARVEKGSVDGSDFYKVQVGRYASRAEADQAASRLKALGYPTKISGS